MGIILFSIENITPGDCCYGLFTEPNGYGEIKFLKLEHEERKKYLSSGLPNQELCSDIILGTSASQFISLSQQIIKCLAIIDSMWHHRSARACANPKYNLLLIQSEPIVRDQV